MSIHVVEDLGREDPFRYHFADPDAMLCCDNPGCSVPWVTRGGLVAWMVEDGPSSGIVTDRIVVGCSTERLNAAFAANGRRRRGWSSPMAVGDWLATLARSLELDPLRTPISKIVGVP